MMMNSQREQISILLVDDDEDDFILTQDYLSEIEHIDYDLTWVDNYTNGLKHILSNDFDICLIDYRLGEHTGLELLKEAVLKNCHSPIIMLTGKGDKEIDVLSMKAGAYDFLVKGEINADNLERAIRYALDRANNLNIIVEQQNRYRDIFQQSHDAIFVVDNKGNFTEANKGMLDLLGMNKENLLNLKFADIFETSESYEGFLQANNISSGNVETQIKTKEDKLVECSISAVSVKNSSNEIVGMQGIIHDLTTLKKAERELRIAEKLSLTGRLARTIAHEVRNPLTNINLATEQLLESLQELEDDELTIYPEIIQRNSERINELITKLLNSAKPSSLELEKVNPNTVLDEALELCMDRVKLLEISLNKNYCKTPPVLMFDVEKIKMALLNILTNAIEAMEEINAPTLSVSTEIEDKDFLISISDNGKGMDAETVNQLFDAFFTGKSHGMGLGMTTTQNIVNSHGGKIEVNSKVGSGTTFRLRFHTNG